VPAEGYVMTLAIAPTNPKRIYVSTTSLSDGTPSVVRTDDAGATWHPFVLPTKDAPVPYIAAIDPLNADRVYVRAPASQGGDVLLVSENAGKDWKQILKAKGTLAGFAVSPDGAQLAVGGPTDSVQLASATDYAFTPVSDVGVTCLTWSADGIFACADQKTAGFSVGLSTDEGAHFEPLFEPSQLTLQVCAAGTPVASHCPNAWHGLAPILGADPATPGYEVSGSGTGGGGGSGNVGGSGSSAGGSSEAGETTGGSAATGSTVVGGQGNGATSAQGGTAPATPTTSHESSGCSIRRAGAAAAWPAGLLLALGISWRARKRSRPARPCARQ
jgi:hypothetical protein